MGFAHVRSLIVVRRHTEKTSTNDPAQESASYYLSSLPPNNPQHFAQLIRGHWAGSEIRNHWIRDALWREDDTRSKNWNLNANLAILRGAILALKAHCLPDCPWPNFFERNANRISLARKLLDATP